MSDIICARVPNEEAGKVWEVAMPFLLRSMEYSRGELTESAIRGGVATKMMDLWIVIDGQQLVGVMLTQVNNYPSGLRALLITLMSGKGLRQWRWAAYDALMEFARAEGCSRLEAIGRKGLTKILEQLGFEPVYTTLVREVGNGKVGQRQHRNKHQSVPELATASSAAVCDGGAEPVWTGGAKAQS